MIEGDAGAVASGSSLWPGAALRSGVRLSAVPGLPTSAGALHALTVRSEQTASASRLRTPIDRIMGPALGFAPGGFVDERLVAFISIATLVVVVPGPDMALVARNVFRHGRGAGYATSIGICVGTLGWALAAGFGVATILATSSALFTALKLAGAAYLIYLGIMTFRDRDAFTAADPAGRPSLSWHRAFLQGLLSNLLNPKLGVFFLTLLPQFVEPGGSVTAQVLQLALLFDSIGILWLLTYSTLLGAVGAVLTRPGPRRAMRWLTGTFLIGLGARVAVERS
jgi:threonine/homoserine/homoserine lactone efflux protein